MDTIKIVVLAAAAIGIASTIIKIASPEGSLKKQLDFIIGIVLVMVIVTPFMAADFSVKLSDYKSSMDLRLYDKIDNYSTEYTLSSAEKAAEEYFIQKFSEESINVTSIIIIAAVDEYNQVEFTQTDITANEKYKDRITKLISAELPDTDLNFISEDSSESI